MRRLAATALVAGLLMLGGAVAQHEHGSGDQLTLGDAMRILTQSGFAPLEADGHEHGKVHLDVLYAHPTLYRAGGNEVPDAVYAGEEIVVFVTENIHAGEMTWDPVELDLYVGQRGPLEPVRSEVVTPDPHHRVTRHHYRADEEGADLLANDAASLQLRAGDGDHEVTYAWDLPLELGDVQYMGLEPSDEPLNLSDAEVLRVDATDEGYAPDTLTAEVGEPVIVVFRNDRDVEHHFHVMDLQIDGTMRWLRTAGEADLFTDGELRSAAQLPDHICDSESGICPTGQSVHLHANPHGSDAIAFVPQEVGTFEVTDPLHPERSAPFRVTSTADDER